MSNDERVGSSRNEMVPDGDHPTPSDGKALGAEGTTLSGDVSSRVDVPAARLSDGAIPRRSSRAGSLTAKGREYRMDLARANCSRLTNQLNRQEKLIRELLWSSYPAERINHETLTYDKIMVGLSAAYRQFIELLENNDEKDAASKSLNELRGDVSSFKEEIYASLEAVEQQGDHAFGDASREMDFES